MRKLFLVALGVFSCLVPAASLKAHSSLPTVLPNCVGTPQSKPSQVILACGDGNVYANKLNWKSWGQLYAHASGVLEMNDCTPDCARGRFHLYQASLTAYGEQRCPDGKIAYKTVKYHVGDPKWPQHENRDYSFDFPCRPAL